MQIERTSWGILLKTVRINRGLKLRDLAEMSGVSANQISKVENGTAEPTEFSKAKIAKALGMKVAELFPYDVYPGGDAR